MTINFYVNRSAENVVTKNIEIAASLTGSLRESCEIETPVFTVAGDSALLTSIVNANYFYIPEFGRYYFMTKKPKILRTGIYEVTGKVDVLMSFADTIRANSAIIKKQTFKNNTILNDGSFKVYQNTETVTKQFPHGFSGTTYVLMTAG